MQKKVMPSFEAKDNSQALQQQVQTALSKSQALSIKGSGSKDFYGHSVAGEIINISSHSGILHYSPAELVLSARAGTPLQEIEAKLFENGQSLACEAPHFGPNATFGGMIAAGLAGPARPFGGSIADLILGCTILNGKGEILRFGGKVIKNVAGYDVSRLMVGALGCLGIILDATIKVVPKTSAQRSFRFDIESDKTKVFINKLCALGFPVSASVYDSSFKQNCLLVRFSAAADEINQLDKSLHNELGGLAFVAAHEQDYWLNLKEHKLDFFNSDENIWRISVAPNTSSLALAGESLIEWNGALRWLKTSATAAEVFSQVQKLGGSATLFRQAQPAKQVFQPLSEPLLHWQQQLKKAFDPAGIFNPGRMYRDL